MNLGGHNSAVTDRLFLWPPCSALGWLTHSIWRKGDSAGQVGFPFPDSPHQVGGSSRVPWGCLLAPQPYVWLRATLSECTPVSEQEEPWGPGGLRSVHWDPEAKLLSLSWRPISESLASLGLVGCNPVKPPDLAPISVRGDAGVTPTEAPRRLILLGQ